MFKNISNCLYIRDNIPWNCRNVQDRVGDAATIFLGGLISNIGFLSVNILLL